MNKDRFNKNLQLVYHDTFLNYCNFLQEKIDLSSHPWFRDLKIIIEENMLNQFARKLNNKDKIEAIVKYLVCKNDIVKYKSFINIWKTYDLAIANQFEEALKTTVINFGLEKVDDNVQITSLSGRLSSRFFKPFFGSFVHIILSLNIF